MRERKLGIGPEKAIRIEQEGWRCLGAELQLPQNLCAATKREQQIPHVNRRNRFRGGRRFQAQGQKIFRGRGK
ncbi:MAG TPA: hypothetical protein VFM21_03365 [Terriglobia bacterium]|nr:hypothetical protein [Terriglobia bacterium]